MISYQTVFAMHQRLEELNFCRRGVRDNNLLLSAIGGQQWYQDIFKQYIHVAYSINAFHIFFDGNKRTCFLVLKELNKFRYYFDDSLLSDEVLNLANNSGMSKDEFYNRVYNCLL